MTKDGTPFSLDVFREVIDINLVGSFNVARLVAARIAKSFPPPPDHSHPDAPPVEHDRGVIIFTSSVSYEEGQMGQTAYASSKAGVVGLVLPMARDLARYGPPMLFCSPAETEPQYADVLLPFCLISPPGIRVVAIAPSLFATAMGANTSPRCASPLPAPCSMRLLTGYVLRRVKEGLLKSTLFPARFGEASEFGHLAVSVIENSYLNGTGVFLRSHVPSRVFPG